MDLTPFLSPADADRAARTLAMLRRHSIAPLVHAGGLAAELHCVCLGLAAQTRPLNDIDFLVDRFDEIPPTLSADLLFRHVHPHDLPGKTLMQCVDPAMGIRIDIFRACGATTARAISIDLCGETMRMISIEDVLARTARLCMDLVANTRLEAKHARNFLRLLTLTESGGVELAWQDHRKPSHPDSFADAANLIQGSIAAREDLQIVSEYSQNVLAICSRCESTEDFPLAEAADVLSLLGYC
ncbi:MAG: hypothetical protein ABR987_06375 [Terracidiphilus sp.]|jgi:hypothetical protein